MAVIEQLGNLEYKITLNTDGLERGQKKASSIMSRLDTNLGRIANLNLASQGVMAFSKRLIGMGASVVKAATTMQSLERGLAAVAGGIAEALVVTAVGLFVAVPAVWMFNYFTGKVESFDVEMDNSSSELIDYFIKRVGK